MKWTLSISFQMEMILFWVFVVNYHGFSCFKVQELPPFLLLLAHIFSSLDKSHQLLFVVQSWLHWYRCNKGRVNVVWATYMILDYKHQSLSKTTTNTIPLWQRPLFPDLKPGGLLHWKGCGKLILMELYFGILNNCGGCCGSRFSGKSDGSFVSKVSFTFCGC